MAASAALPKSTPAKAARSGTTGKARPREQRRLSTKAELDGLAQLIEKIGREIEAHLARHPQPKGKVEMRFTVVADGNRVSLASAELPETKPSAPAKPKGVFDPMEAGRRAVETLKNAEGGSFTGEELEQAFGLNAATLHRRRKEHRIVFWRDAQHKFHYPKWQFTGSGSLLAGVQEVVQTFASPDEWRVMRYFLATRRQLNDQAPLDLLRAGEVTKVVEHARANAEENSW